jgi:hypothetical protein
VRLRQLEHAPPDWLLKAIGPFLVSVLGHEVKLFWRRAALALDATAVLRAESSRARPWAAADGSDRRAGVRPRFGSGRACWPRAGSVARELARGRWGESPAPAVYGPVNEGRVMTTPSKFIESQRRLRVGRGRPRPSDDSGCAGNNQCRA